MAEEPIIYLSPEEELTSVRERLKRVATRRLTLVIPAQTQLRSHMSWRLLYARAQELGKDVLIISSDRQIRSVVKAVGFRVAESLASSPPQPANGESPPPGRNRPSLTQRPDRGMLGGKGSQGRHKFPSSKTTLPPDTTVPPRGETSSSPSTFTYEPQERERRSEQNYEYRVKSTSAPLYPVPSQDEDEEPNLWAQDLDRAQHIRDAAQTHNGDAYQFSSTSNRVREGETSTTYPGLSSPNDHPDISQYPTIDTLHGEFEDQGDLGEVRTLSQQSGSDWQESRLPRKDAADSSLAFDHAQDEMSAPSRHQRGASSPLGKRPPRGSGQLEPKAVALPKPRQGERRNRPYSGRPDTHQGRSSSASGLRSLLFPGKSLGPTAATSSQKKQSVEGIGVFILIGVVIFVVIGLLAYLLPSADVTLVLPSQAFQVKTTLTASASSRQNVTQHTLPASTLVYTTSIRGIGQATGSAIVGTVLATGSVIFSNNGTQSVIVPSHVILATKDGVQFSTAAEMLVPVGNTFPTPIQAQTPGERGNVPANSITVIPPTSQAMIQQNNPNVSLNISVTNSSATSGGGASTVPAVSNADVATQKAALDQKLQGPIQTWLNSQLQLGDTVGKPVRVETVLVTPTVGSVAQNGTFNETLQLHLTVLVVRAHDLQVAALAQLSAALSKQHPELALVPQQHVQFTQLTSNAAKDGSSLSLNFIATSQVTMRISEDTVRSLIAGKSLTDAQQNLTTGALHSVLHAQITVYPSFIHWVPFMVQRINVHFNAEPVKNPPKPKAKH